jgi:hypothetical protein
MRVTLAASWRAMVAFARRNVVGQTVMLPASP